MRSSRISRSRSLLLGAALVVAAFQAAPEDIDIFSVDTDDIVNNPSVLIVLDNTSNWSRQSQQWPGGEQQGQSEVAAIAEVIADLPDTVNVGLMEFVTEGTANDIGGYIRYHIRPMTTDNKAALITELDEIYDNVNAPVEKRNSNTEYGTLMYDVYNYLKGVDQSQAGAGTPASRADAAGYASSGSYATFRSPLTSGNPCGRTIVVFIGNADSSGPTGDGADNVTDLETAGGNTDQIKFADNVTQTAPATVDWEMSASCHASAAACTSTENDADCVAAGFNSCSCDATSAEECLLEHFEVIGTQTTAGTPTTVSDTTTATANTYTGEATYCQNNAPPAYTCPTTTTTSSTSGNQTTAVTTSWSSCSYVELANTCGNNNNKSTWEPRGTKTVRTVVTQSTTVVSQTPVGTTSACYTSNATCSTAEFAAECAGYNTGCTCTTAAGTSGCGSSGTSKFMVQGTYDATTVTPTGTFSVPPTQAGKNFMADEWARFLRQVGVPIPNSTETAEVTTYTIDVFNAQQSATQTSLLFNMARVGGGKYFAARNKNSLVDALEFIFSEVQAVNSAFSSASLPVNATNRAQNENQVYIGVFKPDREKDPRWFGNVKRYQLITSNGAVDLGDANGDPAINLQTGFIGDCAASFWTTDSGDYWSNVIEVTDIEGNCSGFDPDSDLPDGPFVEKGAVAEVLRKGNSPSASADADGNYTLNRNIKTVSSSTLVDFNTTNVTSIDADIVNFIRGEDLGDADDDGNLTEPRASIHGDVVHSRPQPINYAGSTGVIVFYGANDGTYRAVKASTGEEIWSFIAPEHVSKLERLYLNAPVVRFFGDAGDSEPKDYFFDGSTGVYQEDESSAVWIYPSMRRGGRRVYAFDVTTPSSPSFKWSRGCPNLDDDTGCDSGFSGIGETWSIPTPAFVKAHQDGDLPVLIFGGGYDDCEDSDTKSPSCGSAKGRGVYVLNADTGATLRYFDFSSVSGARSVAADVAVLDIDSDGNVDYAYAADTGGSIYRMDFINNPTDKTPVSDPNAWRWHRVAHTEASDGRKFLFPPAVLQNNTTVYLAIGSGDREHPLVSQYPAPDQDNVENRFYVFKDDLTDDLTDSDATGALLNLDDPDSAVMQDRTDPQDCTADKLLPGTAAAGWYMDLGDGEQVVTSALIVTGFVIFSTNQPTLDDSSVQACTASLGTARGYIVNLLTASGAIGTDDLCGGDRSSEFVGGGLPPSPVVASVPIDGEQTTVVIGAVPRDGEPGTPITPVDFPPPITSIRRPVYWYKQTDTE